MSRRTKKKLKFSAKSVRTNSLHSKIREQIFRFNPLTVHGPQVTSWVQFKFYFVVSKCKNQFQHLS